jgi:hypothetical protein
VPIVVLVNNNAHYCADANQTISALHETLLIQARKKLEWIKEDAKSRADWAAEGVDAAEIKRRIEERNDIYERTTGRKREVLWPRKLYLQGDNGPANKNNAFFQYCGWLVREGIFDVVRASFMMVGHTHDIVDQVFSRISYGLKGQTILTVNSFIDKIPEYYTSLSVKNVEKAQYKASETTLNARETINQQVSTYFLHCHSVHLVMK